MTKCKKRKKKKGKGYRSDPTGTHTKRNIYRTNLKLRKTETFKYISDKPSSKTNYKGIY